MTRIGSLATGYGGLDLAIESVIPGASLAWVADIEPGPRKILAHRFPDVPNLGDITAVDWSALEPVDIICGGTPCQDLSTAGRRAGMREGTRSNLWVAMREAIATIRPQLVIWENVDGAHSAHAASDLEPCAGCVGDPGGRTALRALGRVLGDLASLGYDAQWISLRAADVGACHGRRRVFIAAYPRGERCLERGLAAPGQATGRRPFGELAGRGRALPTPTVRDFKGHNQRRDDTCLTGALLPTPSAADGLGGHEARGGERGNELLLPGIAKAYAEGKLLPTPAAGNFNDGEGSASWLARRERVKLTANNGNGMGMPLTIAVQLLPTPTSQAAKHSADGGPETLDDANLWAIAARLGGTPSGRVVSPEWMMGQLEHGEHPESVPGQDLRDVREDVQPEPIQRQAGRPSALPDAPQLFAGMREHEGGSEARHSALAGEEAQGADMCGVRDDRGPACSSHRPEPGEQSPRELGDALRVLPSHDSLAGGPREPNGGRAEGRENCGCAAWGQYAAAVHRHEQVIGRAAPAPTEIGPKGNPRLSAFAVEWMMCLPAGWVTDPAIWHGWTPTKARNAQLKALGNGVVPPQAIAALRWLLDMSEVSA